MTKTIIEHGTVFYKKRCKCGCGERIPVKESHKINGIPVYIHGHQNRKNSPFKKGHEYGFKKGKKHPYYGKHLSKSTRRKMSKAKKGNENGFKKGQCGIEHPAFVDGLGNYGSNSRNRGLECIPMNEPFSNCEMHHLDKDVVMFIPSKLHQSVRHSLETGKGMVRMNNLAYAWFNEQT